MAVNHHRALAALCALAGCQGADRTLTTAQAECSECVDPETTTDQSYVSIGVMPARYPIDWTSPNSMYVTTIAASAGFAGPSLTNPHGIGHVLLKVRCANAASAADKAPFYLSQTGANDPAAVQFRELDATRVNMMFKTYDKDGKLYTDADAEKDWNDSIKRQEATAASGTYESDPAKLDDKDLKLAQQFKDRLKITVDIDALIRRITALPRVSRPFFLKAAIQINDAQCKAIRDWRDAYKRTGGPTRYAVHRAPWVMDAQGDHDGGACGSVSFAGAFYIAGLDFRQAAARVIETPQIGTGRLTAPIARDGRKRDGWYLLQRKADVTPAAVPCAETPAKQCLALGKPWLDPLYDKWNGPEDLAGMFNLSWPVDGAAGKPVKSSTVPLVAFEPEKFYQEIWKRWNQREHDAFAHKPWCKIDGKVPTIVLDGRRTGDKDRTGRDGQKPGFDSAEVNLF
jgi:hypothetical protein